MTVQLWGRELNITQEQLDEYAESQAVVHEAWKEARKKARSEEGKRLTREKNERKAAGKPPCPGVEATPENIAARLGALSWENEYWVYQTYYRWSSGCWKWIDESHSYEKPISRAFWFLREHWFDNARTNPEFQVGMLDLLAKIGPESVRDEANSLRALHAQ